MAETKHILITGATGFIGQHLLEDLLNLNYKISIITRDPAKAMRVHSEKIQVLKADLNDVNSLTAAFKGVDCLVNIAAEVRNEKQMAVTNIQGTHNLVEAALANNIQRIIHISSVGVVGMQYSLSAVVVNEDQLCLPKNEYERSKLESEHIWRKAAIDNNLNLAILRPTNVFGEHYAKKVLLNLFTKLKSNSFFVCSKHAVANFVYVKDVTGAIVQLIHQNEQNGVFNVGESIPLITFVQYMAQSLGKNIKVIYLPKFVFSILNLFGIPQIRPLSNAVSYSDSKLKGIMQYPKGVQQGLKNTWEYYRSTTLN